MQLPNAAARVVRATTELTSGQKWVWHEIWTLDRGPGRAFISAVHLARRLGMGGDNIEKARRELRDLGLLGSGPRPGRKDTTWWPILPARCVPKSGRPSDDEVVKLAAVLDDLLRDLRLRREANQGGLQYAGPPGQRGVPQSAPTTAPGGVLQSASSAASGGVLQSAIEGGEVGGEGATSSLQEVGTTSPPSTPPSEVGEEAGAFARERVEVGRTDPMLANWRTILEKPLASRQPVAIGSMLRSPQSA